MIPLPKRLVLLALFLYGIISVARSSFAQPSLAIDFNDRSNDFPGNTQEAFDSFILNNIGGNSAVQFGTNSLAYGNVLISISDLAGLGCDDRKRSTPVTNGAFTDAQVLQDVIFAMGPTATNGLNIRIQGLASNQSCQITIWSFDSGSPGAHVSNWYANGVPVKDHYTFDGSVLPTSNLQYQFTFSATTSPGGELLITGQGDPSSLSPAVFLNAMQISPVPSQAPPCNTLSHFSPGSNLYGWTAGYTTDEQDQEIAALKEAGVQWVRINVVWFAVEPNQKGTYDPSLLTLYDHLMAKLAENEIRAIFVTADTPYWASTDPAKANGVWNQKYKPTNNHDLADYFVFLLNRYRATGPHAFEIWNEENASAFWPSGVNAADYFNMLQTCFNAIKAADPLALVLNGGLTDGSNATNFMASLYALGAKNYFDAWSQHTYPKTPQYETIVSKVRNIMSANGDSSKKIWMTECGWLTSSNVAETGAVSFNRQAHYLSNIFTRFVTYPEVSVVCWYTSRSFDESTHEGSFGLMLPDFTRKPSFYAYKDWVAAAGAVCPPTHMTLLSPIRLPGGVMRVGFNGTTGVTHSVQASSNLQDWVTIATNIFGTGSYYDDTAATNLPSRFYRLAWP
ncbi:MAG TPA: beta-galactosidase [Candidatus Dormibacteraeota bacterium]|nr:beta-galactosidase [Candidatus Dormibacteraeota bacterium]